MRYLRSILLLLLLLPLTGCWDRLEVNDVAIVDMVGVDKAGTGLRLTVSVVIPERAKSTPSEGSPGGSTTRPAISFGAEGQSVMQAASRIQERLPRRLFWAHTRVLVFGEEYARRGVAPALDFWSRHREPRLQMQIAITPGRAADLILVKPRMERLLSETIRETINQNLQTSVSIREFLSALRSETQEPIAPRVEIILDHGAPDVQVSGTAVFQDDRLVGWLSDAETRGLLWLRGEIHTGVATVSVPSGGKVSMMLIRGRTSIRPDFRTGRLRIHAEVVVDDDIYETSAPVDLGKADTVDAMQELLRQDVERRMRATLRKVQREFRADVLRFADAVYRGAPVRWEGGLRQRWREVFPDLPVDLVVKTHVRRTGEHGAPLGTKKQQIKSNPKELLKPKE
jgi:spore germination protein KC